MSAPLPHRALRIDPAIWNAAKDKAATEGVTVSELVRRLLREYVGAEVSK